MKKPKRKTLIKKLDNIFSKYIRLRKAKNQYATCVTCGKVDHWTKLQAGHFISRRHYATRWDTTNVQVQCSGCNVFKYGEQYKFSLWLDKNIATGTSEQLLLKSQNIVKYTNDQLQQKIGYYNNLVDKLL